ncbi:MAG: aminodeoxychorismate/anthranilate synthase component II [Planctomycetota bacterium]|nr:MAG: aminodeoxychorismate/anthranilate synthase component II [Planctomycetota bacterium]
MILLIDNYDSFVHNLARYFALLGQDTLVVRNDAVTPAQVRQLQPQAVVLSPGPCTPAEAGSSLDIVVSLHRELPMLGVCLGHQTIAAALGGTVVRAAEPRHGRTSLISHDGDGLFAGLPSPLTVCRYHSLVVEPGSLPAELVATALADDGSVMAVQHKRLPICGVQFHPEATLTQRGFQLLANFLRIAGCAVRGEPAVLAAREVRVAAEPAAAAPMGPVTF